MSAPTHTPGPWVVDEFLEDVGIYKIRSNASPHDSILCHTHVFADSKSGTTPEAEANARLVAAAPDLLEALRDLYELYQFGWLTGADIAVARSMQQAFSAIVKAVGAEAVEAER